MQSDLLVPFLDLKKQYNSLKNEINDAIQGILTQATFIKGKAVQDFEKAFSDYVEADYCIGVGNGTDAIILTLKALGIGIGDEVITVGNTFIATVEAIVAVGAVPVLLDINYETYTMEPREIENAINEKTKAIIPVHLYGMPCDMDPIMEIAKKYNLRVICDAAQAHGAHYKGNTLSQYGDAITYSFYPGKNLGAYGDAGAVVTNNQELADRVRMLANHGRKDKYLHNCYGYNSRLDAIQAVVLSVKLHYLDRWNARRKEIAKYYENAFSEITQVITPFVPDYADPVWHLYVIRTKRRDELRNYLLNRGIETGIHYPVPITHQPAAKNVISRCKRERLKALCDEIISLPICPEMSDEMVAYVVNCTYDFFKQV